MGGMIAMPSKAVRWAMRVVDLQDDEIKKLRARVKELEQIVDDLNKENATLLENLAEMRCNDGL
jgi:ribosomal protein S13